MNKIPTFCLSHVAPLVKLSECDYLVKPRRVELPGVFKKLDISGDGVENDLIFSDYAMMNALAINQEIYSCYKLIRVIYYRRFCSSLVFGIKSRSLPYAKIATPFECEEKLLGMDEELSFLQKNSSALICKPLKVESLARNYSRSHLADDFCMFVLTLKEVLSWSVAECNEFVECGVLIPGPNVGVFHVDFFKKITVDILKISNFFLDNCYTPREGYQRRVLGFLLERYFSYCVYREYFGKNKRSFIVGSTYLISESGDYIRTE